MSIASGYRGTDVIMREHLARTGQKDFDFLTLNDNSMERMFEQLKHGGKIVSSSQCTELEIAQARACDRFYVDERGFGFVYLP